jgi:hypothetical protein
MKGLHITTFPPIILTISPKVLPSLAMAKKGSRIHLTGSSETFFKHIFLYVGLKKGKNSSYT